MPDIYIIRQGDKYECLTMEELMDLAKRSNKKINALKVTSYDTVTAEPVLTARITRKERDSQ